MKGSEHMTVSGNTGMQETCLGDSQDDCPKRTAVLTPRS